MLKRSMSVDDPLMTRLLTLDDVADRLGVTKEWVWAQASVEPESAVLRAGERMA